MTNDSITTILNSALTLVNQQLLAFTTDAKFNDKLTLTFGNAINPESYQNLWTSSNFNLESVIEIIPQSELNGANGAFSRNTGKIYLAQEYLTANNNNSIVALILEEYGHLIDAQVNPVESLGDEGAIFSVLVLGENLSEETLQALKTEDDTATITLNGQSISIEMAIINGTNSNDTLTGNSESDSINGLGGNDSINGGGGNDTIIGGSGNDTFTGGSGNDLFNFERYQDSDLAMDFTLGQDKIDVRNLNISEWATVQLLISGDGFNNALITTYFDGYNPHSARHQVI